MISTRNCGRRADRDDHEGNNSGGDKTVEEATYAWLLDHVDDGRPAVDIWMIHVFKSKKKASVESQLAFAGVALADGLVLAFVFGCLLDAAWRRSRTVWKSTSASGAPDNSSLSHFSAMTRPSWLRRAVRNRHRHAIEQAASMAWRTTR